MEGGTPFPERTHCRFGWPHVPAVLSSAARRAHRACPCPIGRRQLGLRAGRFADVLFAREETHLAVAAHSAFLLAIFNAVFACDEEATRTWFGTGEMRTVLLHLEQAGANSGDQALDGKAYLEQFGVQTKLSKAIATVLRDRPNNPLLAISEILQVK